jgi:secreted trypsin-like serine protease
LFLRFLVVSVASLALAAPAVAITGGSLDGGAHPAVGLLLADRGNGPEPACSGTLVSPTAFLTAGHCTAALSSSRVWVSFDSQWSPSSERFAGTAHTDPLFGQDRNDSHDLAVVVLDAPVSSIAPLALAGSGALDAKVATVDAVGYGADQAAADKKNPAFSFDFTRRWATADVAGVSKTELRLSTRAGGTCHGDSGGPELVGSTVVAVTSHGDAACTKQSYAYRVDTVGARAFLSRFVPLP